MADILDKMNAADVLVMASPVYFYSIDAQMKALIDRTVAQWLTIKNKGILLHHDRRRGKRYRHGLHA